MLGQPTVAADMPLPTAAIGAVVAVCRTALAEPAATVGYSPSAYHPCTAHWLKYAHSRVASPLQKLTVPGTGEPEPLTNICPGGSGSQSKSHLGANRLQLGVQVLAEVVALVEEGDLGLQVAPHLEVWCRG